MRDNDGGVLAVQGASMVGHVVCWRCVVVDEDVEEGGEMMEIENRDGV